MYANKISNFNAMRKASIDNNNYSAATYWAQKVIDVYNSSRVIASLPTMKMIEA